VIRQHLSPGVTYDTLRTTVCRSGYAWAVLLNCKSLMHRQAGAVLPQCFSSGSILARFMAIATAHHAGW
jgi:hypothetical protein